MFIIHFFLYNLEKQGYTKITGNAENKKTHAGVRIQKQLFRISGNRKEHEIWQF